MARLLEVLAALAALLAPAAALVSAPAGAHSDGGGLAAGWHQQTPHGKRPAGRFQIRKGSVTYYHRQELINIDDTRYHANITMGGQVHSAMLDSGSIELMVFSSACRYWCGDRTGFYNASGSGQHSEGGLHVVMSYQAGTLFGREAYDSMWVGPMKVDDQPFWEIVDANMPVLFEERDYQAILGLGPVDPQVKTMKMATDNSHAFAVVFESLNASTYSLCLKPGVGMNGYLTWHDKVHVEHASLFSRLRVIESGFWLLKLTNVRLGDRAIGCRRGCGAILDSGATFLAAPRRAERTFRDVVKSIGRKCDDLSSMPNLKFELDRVPIELPPDAYMAKVDGKPSEDVKSNWGRMDGYHGNESCQDVLMHVDMTSDLGDTWILGIPFFRSYYAVFEQGIRNSHKPAVYIAKAGPDCDPTARPTAMASGGQGLSSARRIKLEKVRLPKWVNHTRKARRVHKLWGGDRTIVKSRVWKKIEAERASGKPGWHPFLDLDGDGDMDEDDMLAYMHGNEVTDPDSGF